MSFSNGRSLDIPQSDSVQGVEYGFGYRTQFDDGATSTVVFVSGPDSKKMNLLRSRKPEARKLASDILDAKTSEEKNEKINLALSNDIPGFNFDALVEAFPDFKPLEEHGTGVVHLFSHPANVFPLSTPTQTTTSIPETTPTSDSASNDDPESIAVESADNDTPLARTNENSEKDKEAESIIQETKVRIDEIQNRNSGEQSSTESYSSTSSTSSESPNTTSKNEEEQETTTQQ
ncbi:uncharacterized protein LOC123310411 [Coccinella septempunctata]|uniref:uncharacterized protein LOC123310411 n=1 Tax=Coccinella septempunctata TaxID=41139 RepID=UPI001D096F6F|nr:uncharacterized protein LOC123310411 [Coccinella septempunctata]